MHRVLKGSQDPSCSLAPTNRQHLGDADDTNTLHRHGRGGFHPLQIPNSSFLSQEHRAGLRLRLMSLKGAGGEGNPHPAEDLENRKAKNSGSWKQLSAVGGEKPFHSLATCRTRGERVLGVSRSGWHCWGGTAAGMAPLLPPQGRSLFGDEKWPWRGFVPVQDGAQPEKPRRAKRRGDMKSSCLARGCPATSPLLFLVQASRCCRMGTRSWHALWSHQAGTRPKAPNL